MAVAAPAEAPAETPAEAPAETPAEAPAPATLELPPAPAPAGHDPLAALLADPVLMDRLAKAVAARLGNDALREVAWEVMPELAERIGRP